MPKTIHLKVGESRMLKSGLRITLRDIVYEELAEVPDSPGGVGVIAMLILDSDKKNTTLELDRLPDGYESHSEREWGGFSIRLLGASGDEATLKIQSAK
jgi:hypothetical protein